MCKCSSYHSFGILYSNLHHSQNSPLKPILSIALTLFAFGHSAFAQQKTTPTYKDPKAPIEVRLKDLLARMTLEEKVAQTTCLWSQKSLIVDAKWKFDPAKAKAVLADGIGQIARPNETKGADGLSPSETVIFGNAIQKFLKEKTRLGIPAIFHEESLHGNQAVGATNFPSPLALASSWNPDLMTEIYTTVAKEVRARGGHQVLAPVVDIARDPRWGRTEETMGEDPYLTARLAVQVVKAYQGPNAELGAGKVISTLKHFPVHGTPEGGVNIAPSFVDERTVREVNFPPFKACVEEAGVLGVMPCYNELSGVPAHANGRYINGVLRKEWGFKGIVVSDYMAIHELKTFHKIAQDTADAAIKALNAGVDVELPDRLCYPKIVGLVKSGLISMAVLDSAVARHLRLKFRMGLFENPYADAKLAEATIGSQPHRDIALAAARQSITLLQNNGILPLQASAGSRIALIGPNADKCILGGYSSIPKQKVTPLQAITAMAGPNFLVSYAEGGRLTDRGDWFFDSTTLSSPQSNKVRLAEAMKVARNADVIVLCLGSNEAISREAWSFSHMGDTPNLDLLGNQNELVDSLKTLGKPMVGFFFSGPPLALTRVQPKLDAMVQCFYLGQETGTAVAEVLFGKTNPSGKLTISMPRSAGHLPCYYSYKPSGRRGYIFEDIAPLFPFGFGLSYSTFQYGKPNIAKSVIGQTESTTVTIEITNTSKIAGMETVQLYLRDDVSSVTRPVKELKDFKKITLAPGETKKVTFNITPEKLKFYNEAMQWVLEPGTFTAMVGASSANTQSLSFEVK